ncbi:phage tail tape measure protein [Paraclostridium sordellii]|uniref:phage tail tape measure protein n=1 Tax=Paraclostridium sordellii TaxID=1505 RepID=UPI0005DD7B44|nr:phage tail tape measure protein [Paeniclostridium sordellii]CEO07665.1 phage tail tape measure protein [[Clostridium] sordellii] [Paeniclostridium sordellii]
MGDTEKRITAKMILDDSGYSSTLKGINSEIKNNKSELKAAQSGLEAFGKSTEGVNRVQSSLQKQLDLQNKKLETYKKSVHDATETLQKNISERDKLASSLSKAEKAHENAIKNYGKESKEAKETEKALEELQKEHDKLDRTVENNAKTLQNYETQMNKAEEEVNKAQSAVNKFNREVENTHGVGNASKKLEDLGNNFKRVGSKAQEIGGKLTTHVSLPLTGIGVAAAHVGMEYEAQMDKVAAISGATGDDLKQLENKAQEMGAKTKFSAAEAGEGMEYMAMAGWKTGDMLEGIEPILNLAIASGEELGSTSDIVTDALTGFGLKAKDAGMFSDVLAAASSNANTNVGMMGETFKYAAPVAGALGYSVQDTSLAIGLMANSGIKASQAGTALRAGLTNLVKPTDSMAEMMEKYGISVENSDGKMKSFREVMSDLREKMGGLDEATQASAVATIFGKEAMSGWLSIINASEGDFNKLANAIDNSEGATAKMAKTMSENAKGSLAEMKSALEGAAIKVFQALAPAITSVAKDITKLATSFSNLSPHTQEFIVKAGMAAIAMGPVISGLGHVTSGIGGLIGTVGKFKALKAAATFKDFSKILLGLAPAAETAGAGLAGAEVAGAGFGATVIGCLGPIALGVAAVAAVGYAGYKVAEHLNKSATPAVDLFADKVEQSRDKFGNYAQATEKDVIKISKATKDNVQAYLDLDKKASESMMNLKMNSNKFSKEAKDSVLKNFTEMSKKSSNLSKEQKEKMTIDLKKLVTDTGVLTSKNKNEIIKQYTAMVNGTKGLTQKQKDQTIKDFKDTLTKSVGLSKQQSQEMQKVYTDMANKIKDGMDKKRDAELKSQKDFFAKTTVLSAKEKEEALNQTKSHWTKQKQEIDKAQTKINEIYERAANEHRELKKEEFAEIDSLQNEMKTSAIKTLSENEVEAKVILERMKGNDEHITAEMASKHIKELNASRDKAIEAANDECDKRIAEVYRMQQETGSISEEQRDKLIEDAKKQRDETVAAAKETRDKAVDEVTSMNSDISKDVDTTTGKVKSDLDKIKDWWDNWHPIKKVLEVFTKHTNDGKKPDGNWTGNSHFKGGLTYLHERGYELYDLPSGTKVYNHESSEQMVLETARQTAQGVINSMMKNKGDSDGNIIIPINITGEEIDRVVIPRVSNRLALNTMRRRR